MIFNKTKEQLNELKAIYTAQEIYQQPSTWKKTLQQMKDHKEEYQNFIDQVITQEDFDVVLCGAGSSEFVGNSIYTSLSMKLDHKIKSYGTTDIVVSPLQYLSPTKPTLLVSFGRSGNSPESIGAVDTAEAVCQNLHHVFITCNENGALSKGAQDKDNCLAINLTPETHDQSFAMTSSFTNMALAVFLLFNLDRLEEIECELDVVCKCVEKLLDEGYVELEKLVSEYPFERIVYLGSNTLKGTAQESALKMLELTAGKITTMHDTPTGFRHGPKSVVNDETLCVVYYSNEAHANLYEEDLIKEMASQRKGNKVMVVSGVMKEEIKDMVDYYYCFEDLNVENPLLGLAFINVAQLIALFKSLSCGITPDDPCPSGEVNRVVKGVTIYPFK
ncbi:MAG: SIS domain-containing protein [Erysipelotrichaceae bacterium]|nr:SIS domain-containing protein [Erysipelotrichaceae bacterium]